MCTSHFEYWFFVIRPTKINLAQPRKCSKNERKGIIWILAVKRKNNGKTTFSVRYKVGWSYLRNLIICLSTMVFIRQIWGSYSVASVLLLSSKQFQALRTLALVWIEWTWSLNWHHLTSLMLLLYSMQFQAFRTLVMGLDGMNKIFKLATSPNILMSLLFLARNFRF